MSILGKAAPLLNYDQEVNNSRLSSLPYHVETVNLQVPQCPAAPKDELKRHAYNETFSSHSVPSPLFLSPASSPFSDKDAHMNQEHTHMKTPTFCLFLSEWLEELHAACSMHTPGGLIPQ